MKKSGIIIRLTKVLLQVIASFLMFGLTSSGQTLQQAIKLTGNENFEKADNMLKMLLSAQPANSNNYFYRGENFFDWGKTDSASACYQKGLTTDPTNALNYTGAGKIAWYMGKTDESANYFEKAKILSKNKNAIVLMKIAEAYYKAPSKDYASAFALLDKAILLEPENPDVYIDLGDAYLSQNPTDGSKSIEQYQKALSVSQKNVEAMLRLGQLWKNARQYDTSLSYFQKATRMDSTFAPAYREKAELLYDMHHLSDAIAQYQKYLQLNDAMSAKERYAEFLFVAKKYDDAISQTNMIISRDTDNVILYRVLGYSQYEKKDYVSGLHNMTRFFNKVSKTKVKILATDYSYYGKLLAKNGKDSLAIEQLKIAVDKLSGSPVYAQDMADDYFLIGNTYLQDGNCAQAVNFFQKRVGLPGAQGNEYYYLGKAAYCDSLYKLADSAFGMLTKFNPDYPVGYYYRAVSNLRLDTTNAMAKPYYELFIQKVGNDTIRNKDHLLESYDQLGYYYYLQNDKSNASLYYKKALNIDPENAQAKSYFESLKPKKNIKSK